MNWFRLWRALRNPTYFPHQLIDYQSLRIHPVLWLGGLIMMPIAVLPGVLFAGTAYSLQWALEIADAIAAMQDRRRFELLSVLPGGQLAARWHIAIDRISDRYRHPDAQELWSVRMIIGAFILATLRGQVATYDQTANEIAIFGMAFLALLIDHYTAVVIGPLVGMLLPNDGRDRFTLAVLVAGTILGLIFSTMLLAALAGVLIFAPLTTPVMGLALALAFFAVLREAVIALLWRMLLEKSNAQSVSDIIDLYHGNLI